MNWMDDAKCKGKSDLFFAPPGERAGARLMRETMAKSVCAMCPVIDPCREASAGEFGVWAGESEDERGVTISNCRGVYPVAVSVGSAPVEDADDWTNY